MFELLSTIISGGTIQDIHLEDSNFFMRVFLLWKEDKSRLGKRGRSECE